MREPAPIEGAGVSNESTTGTALNAVAIAATAGLGGTAALPPRTAASNSATADDTDASDSATTWSSSSPLSARTVTREPAAVLTVMLIGASVLGIYSP